MEDKEVTMTMEEYKKTLITISMEEYKELLITKGKYEELKSQQRIKINTSDYNIRDLTDRYIAPEPPYKITCKGD